MSPTKKQIGQKIETLASFLDHTIGQPVRKIQNFKSDFYKTREFCSHEIKLLLKEKKRDLELYMLEKRLIEVENRIRKEKEKTLTNK